MSFDDRDWRKEELRQQRQAGNRQIHNMSVNQYLASQRTQHTFKAKRSKLLMVFVFLFLAISLGSAAFLLYQWFPISMP